MSRAASPNGQRSVPKLRAPTPALRAGSAGCRRRARRWRRGRPTRRRETRAAVAALPALAELGAAQAFLAEALNAIRDRGALAAAQRATELNPALVDGWRELGDAKLEADALEEAEAAFRKVVAMDTTYGLGYAKLAQVLLEQGRTLEALDAISEAAQRGGDPFFIAAIRGDIYAEMERHHDAAEPYDQALRVRARRSLGAAPGGHRARLRGEQLARRRSCSRRRCSTTARGATRRWSTTAITCGGWADRRRGEAVPQGGRRGPGDADWKQTLREAERELLAAPKLTGPLALPRARWAQGDAEEHAAAGGGLGGDVRRPAVRAS